MSVKRKLNDEEEEVDEKKKKKRNSEKVGMLTIARAYMQIQSTQLK